MQLIVIDVPIPVTDVTLHHRNDAVPWTHAGYFITNLYRITS